MREKLFFFFVSLLPPEMGAYLLYMREQNKQLDAEIKRMQAENKDLEREIDFWNNMTRAAEKLSEKE